MNTRTGQTATGAGGRLLDMLAAKVHHLKQRKEQWQKQPLPASPRQQPQQEQSSVCPSTLAGRYSHSVPAQGDTAPMVYSSVLKRKREEVPPAAAAVKLEEEPVQKKKKKNGRGRSRGPGPRDDESMHDIVRKMMGLDESGTKRFGPVVKANGNEQTEQDGTKQEQQQQQQQWQDHQIVDEGIKKKKRKKKNKKKGMSSTEVAGDTAVAEATEVKMERGTKRSRMTSGTMNDDSMHDIVRRMMGLDESGTKRFGPKMHENVQPTESRTLTEAPPQTDGQDPRVGNRKPGGMISGLMHILLGDTSNAVDSKDADKFSLCSYFAPGISRRIVETRLRREPFATELCAEDMTLLASVIHMTQDAWSAFDAIVSVFRLLGADDSSMLSTKRQRRHQKDQEHHYQGQQGQHMVESSHFAKAMKHSERLRDIVAECLNRLVPLLRTAPKVIPAVELMKAHDLPLGLQVCKIYLKRLFADGSVRVAMETISQVLGRTDLALDPEIFAIMVEGCAESMDSMARAIDLVAQMQRRGIREDERVYAALIRGHVLHGQINEAESIVQQMRKKNMKPDAQIYATLMEGYVAHVKTMDKVTKLLEQMRSDGVCPDIGINSAVLRCHCRVGDLEKAETMLDLLEREAADVGTQRGKAVRLDRRVYEDLMHGYLLQRRLDMARSLIIRVEGHYGAHQTNIVDWFHIELIAHLLSEGMEEEAEQEFNDVKDKSTGGNERRLARFASFESLKEHLVSSASRRKRARDPKGPGTAAARREKFIVYDMKDMLKNKNPRGALEALTHLHDIGGNLSPSNHSMLDSLMFQLKAIRDTGAIEHLFSLMENMDVPLRVKHYNMLIDAYVKREQLSKAEDTFKKLQLSPTEKPDEFTYTSLVNGFSKAGLTEMAAKYAMQLQDSGAKLSSHVFTSMIDGYARLGNKTMIIRLLNQMRASGIKVNIVTWTAIIKGLMDNGHTRDAMQTYVDMKTRHRMKPDSYLFTVLINGFAKQGDMDNAMRLFDEMQETLGKGALGNLTVTYNALINGFCRKGMMQQAVELFNQMIHKSSQAKPNVRTYTSLINGYIFSHRMDLALDLFDRMKSHNVEPNLHTYTLLIRELSERRHVDKAKALLDEMSHMRIKAGRSLWTFILEGEKLLTITPKKHFSAEKRFVEEQERIRAQSDK